MIFNEKTINSKRIYDGKVIKVRVDTVELPDKKYSKREIVEHPGAVAIVPITEDGYVYMVKQFRKPVESILLEIPAGKLDEGENPLECAIRELKEETGLIANDMKYILEFFTSPGFSNEKMYLYLAQGFKYETNNLDDDEFLDVIKIKFADLLLMIANGEITDSKTIIGILATKSLLSK